METFPRLLKPDEAAALLGVSRRKLNEYRLMGLIAHVRLTRKTIRYVREDMIAFLRQEVGVFPQKKQEAVDGTRQP